MKGIEAVEAKAKSFKARMTVCALSILVTFSLLNMMFKQHTITLNCAFLILSMRMDSARSSKDLLLTVIN